MYLRHSLDHLQCTVDLPAVVRAIKKKLQVDGMSTTVFDSDPFHYLFVVKGTHGKTQVARTMAIEKEQRRLMAAGITVENFGFKRQSVASDNGRVSGYVQKGVDCAIAAFIVASAHNPQVSNIILLAGDSDFTYPVRLAKQAGKVIWIVAEKGSVSPELQQFTGGLSTYLDLAELDIGCPDPPPPDVPVPHIIPTPSEAKMGRVLCNNKIYLENYQVVMYEDEVVQGVIALGQLVHVIVVRDRYTNLNAICVTPIDSPPEPETTPPEPLKLIPGRIARMKDTFGFIATNNGDVFFHVSDTQPRMQIRIGMLVRVLVVPDPRDDSRNRAGLVLPMQHQSDSHVRRRYRW